MNTYLKRPIEEIERSIASYYGFAPVASAHNHIISKNQLQNLITDAESYPEWHAPGSVWLADAHRSDDVFIAIHLDQTIENSILAADPYQNLSNRNLNEFCVLIEEISHFHLLANKIAKGIALPKLELELQGEIDKILVCAKLLYRQTGSCYLPVLLKKICDEPIIEGLLYEQANKHVASFFYQSLNNGSVSHINSNELRRFLRESYLLPWPQKLHTLRNPVFKL